MKRSPIRVGQTKVWPIKGYPGVSICCFMPGSMTWLAAPAGCDDRPKAIGWQKAQVYFWSRSSNSIEMPCGPRMKQMRTPGRMVVGGLVNSTPLALISAATASMSFTVSPK